MKCKMNISGCRSTGYSTIWKTG
ncbi:hypothetical protein LSH36_339g01019 [Paralvinella palmiformis]|uniref:Uncharacterized protein n=1 Tax=Paralvinella palmiformis TaxID=53620 RepID=A0AAD9N009_9ANNE|nr:hypothetical protein LSH36_339g01019 [Paralvinella palmiformis]